MLEPTDSLTVKLGTFRALAPWVHDLWGRVIQRQQTTLLSEGHSHSTSTHHSPIGVAQSFTVNKQLSYRRGRVIQRQQTTLLSEEHSLSSSANHSPIGGAEPFNAYKPLSYRRGRAIQRLQTTLHRSCHSASTNHSPI